MCRRSTLDRGISFQKDKRMDMSRGSCKEHAHAVCIGMCVHTQPPNASRYAAAHGCNTLVDVIVVTLSMLCSIGHSDLRSTIADLQFKRPTTFPGESFSILRSEPSGARSMSIPIESRCTCTSKSQMHIAASLQMRSALDIHLDMLWT